MDTYIVRIYRQEPKKPYLLVGVIEEVGVDGKKAFNNVDELWAILKAEPKISGEMANNMIKDKRSR